MLKSIVLIALTVFLTPGSIECEMFAYDALGVHIYADGGQIDGDSWLEIDPDVRECLNYTVEEGVFHWRSTDGKLTKIKTDATGYFPIPQDIGGTIMAWATATCVCTDLDHGRDSDDWSMTIANL